MDQKPWQSKSNLLAGPVARMSLNHNHGEKGNPEQRTLKLSRMLASGCAHAASPGIVEEMCTRLGTKASIL
jgi:hypothetical protein